MEEEVTSSERTGGGRRTPSSAPAAAGAGAEEDDEELGDSSRSSRRRREDMEREMQMEKFYALLDDIRAIRDSIRLANGKRIKTTAAAAEPAPPAWKPKFELEDFAQDRRAKPAAGENKGKKKKSVEEDDMSRN